MLSAKLVAYEWREKVSAFSLFVCALSEVVKTIGFLCRKIDNDSKTDYVGL